MAVIIVSRASLDTAFIETLADWLHVHIWTRQILQADFCYRWRSDCKMLARGPEYDQRREFFRHVNFYDLICAFMHVSERTRRIMGHYHGHERLILIQTT